VTTDATVVDVHAHILLPGLMGSCGAAGPEMGIRADGVNFFRAGDYVLENVRFVDSPFSDVGLRLEGLDRLGIDHQIVSPNPLTYFYSQPVAEAVRWNRDHNDAMAEVVRAAGPLDGFAGLPLQDPGAACAELVRAVEDLGLVGSYLGTEVGGLPLSDPGFEELWSEHERLGVPVVVHPAPRTIDHPGDAVYGPWDLDILFGFLVDEAMTVAHLVLAGVLDRHPGLHVHVAHGGGFLPYQKGRLEAGLARRPWAEGLLQRPFADQWAQLSFDSAVHRADALAFLVATEGATRVLLGTNFAGWDHDAGAMAMVDELVLDDADRAAILGANAQRLFRL
jgi:aminocarboxymuconate-semialdehyde decarboxylase